jgi:ATP-binding cassette subfamily F protein 3
MCFFRAAQALLSRFLRGSSGMASAQFSKVSCSFGGRVILNSVTLHITKGVKAALTGANGSGKTTLLKIMAGITEPDDGSRAVEKGARVSYLPQSGIVHKGATLWQEADKAFLFGYEIERQMEEIGDALKRNSGDTKQLLERYQALSDKLENSFWRMRNARIEQVLTGLGFLKADFDSDTQKFSGGWQMRIALAKVLLENPDILLLDEPTNYLDLEARNWLEQFLLDFSGGFLLVSHDRYFLDVTINCVYELFNGSLRRYVGNYSAYEKTRQTELESLMARYERQQEEIRRMEDFIRRFGAKESKAAAAQERKKILEKMDRIEIPESFVRMRFRFPPAPHCGKIALTAQGITKSYDGRTRVIDSLELVVEKGERLVVAGKNGAGKTTLLRILTGRDNSFEGGVKLGAGAAVGYFSQDNAEFLDHDAVALDFIERLAPLEIIPKVRDLLGAFLFRGDDVFKKIAVLSGGEKSRLALLALLLAPVNTLILDEPTNHLDLHSKDVLLNALKDFAGTVIFVSHDRGFIESLATRVLELRAGLPARVFPGGYAYYLERLESESKAESRGSESEARGAVRFEKIAHNEKQSADERKAQTLAYKQEKAERRRLAREEERLMDEIATLEDEAKALRAELENPAVYSDYAKSAGVQKKIDEVSTAIDERCERWEKVRALIEKH